MATFAPGRRQTRALVLGVVVLLAVSLLLLRRADTRTQQAAPAGVSSSSLQGGNADDPRTSPTFCADRFGPKFLDDFRDRRAQYCDSPASASRLTCFHTANAGSFTAGSTDSFCLAQRGAYFDAARSKFVLDCRLREQDLDGAAIPRIADLASYQYLTGPGVLLREWVALDAHVDTRKHKAALAMAQDAHHDDDDDSNNNNNRNLVVLLKREVDGNLWHSLNELMALMTTLDVLRMTPDPDAPGKMLVQPGDAARTDIVLLDEHPDGAFVDLFGLFSDHKPLRLAEWAVARKTKLAAAAATNVLPIDRVVVPYAGAANGLWSDWARLDCADNAMLRAFVQRVFDFYGLARTRPPPPPPPSLFRPRRRLTVTVVTRKGSRRLMGLETHLLAAARARFRSAGADMQLVDFAALPLREQVRVARDTDVLVGVHGAGLTHVVFMERGRGALVEVQPERLCHQGFGNVARMTGHAYVVGGASKVVGRCYDDGDKMLPDDGSALPSSWDPASRCWSGAAADPAAWSFACSEPRATGGDQAFMVCRHANASDAWYETCAAKEAGDMYWLTRYVMEQDRFLDLVARGIDAVRQQDAARAASR